MSVVAYTGLPGHGKSYSAVENIIIPALKQGRTVVHNLKLNELALSVVCDGKGQVVQIPEWSGSEELSPAEELVAFCSTLPGAVYVFDEVWQYVPAGTKVNEVSASVLKFFKQHRHSVAMLGDVEVASEICIIDQELGSGVASFLRDLVELTFIHEKMSAIGAKGNFRVDVYTRAQDAKKPSKSALVRKLRGKYRPEVWNCYLSHTQSKGDKFGFGALETMPDKRGTVWGNTSVQLGIVALVGFPFAMWFLYHAVHKMTGGHDDAKPVISKPVEEVRTVGSGGRLTITTKTPGQEPDMLSGGAESKRWRFAGIIDNAGKSTAVLAGELGTARHIDAAACKRDSGGDWRCKVDGEQVASWTGPKTVEPSNTWAAAGTSTASNLIGSSDK